MVDETSTDRATHEAARWLAALTARHVDQATLDDFFAWRRIPENAAAYAKVESLWDRSAALGGSRDIAEAVQAALARSPRQRRLDAVLEGARARPRLLIAGFACLVIVSVAGSWWSMRPDRYETLIGEQRLVQLADGSSVRLDTSSVITVRLGGRERRVDLEAGQALFSVAHDPNHPFVVHVGGATVQAVGTRFDVRRDPDDDTRVVLAEGRLRLRGTSSDDFDVDLRAGQASTARHGAWSAAEPADVPSMLSWITGRIIFRAQPLTDAVADMNRYAAHRIILAASGIGDDPISGTFDTTDTAGFAAAIAAMQGLTIHQAANGDIVLARPGQS